MFKKPSKSGISTQAVTVGSAVAGAAVSDGIVALIPAEYSKWGKPALALATVIAAAATKTTNTSGKIAQGAFIGMSIKQGLDALRGLIAEQMSPNVADTQIATFTNKVLGLASADTVIQVPRMNNAIFERTLAPRADFGNAALAATPISAKDMLA